MRFQASIRGACRHNYFVVGLIALSSASGNALAQDDSATGEAIEEIVTVGSQIKGAKISDALAVSVITAEDIEILGVESGDELLDLIPENGQNFFNDAETISGGVNAARGDIGAFNLRNMGTGNTLVLLNGRRLVNAAAFQTELIGADFVPVNTVNSNHIPVFGVERVEVLRDGASAIYGADAVAGVVNTVLRDDFEGFTVRAKFNAYDHVPRDDQAISIDWGNTFNEGRTNVGVFARHYRRDRVNSQDEAKWADSDFRRLLPEDSPYAPPDTEFRNDSANSLFGQFDFVSGSARPLTDSRGEFETFPLGDDRCEWQINDVMCGWADRSASNGGGTVRYNLNENRDLISEMDRTTVYAYLNHETESGMELFSEFYWYESNSNMFRHPSASFSSVKLEVGAQNYYNPFGPCGSPNRVNPDFPPDYPEAPCGDEFDEEGEALIIDLYRFAELPRVVDNDGDAIRLLQGIRGTRGDWDWESAVTWSKATKDDITHNRVSNTLMQEALNDPTPAAYNPFSGGLVDSNLERALIDVYRKGETDLAMFDVKFSNPELFELPAGPAGFLVGYEWRRESFVDDRDPRLDGTIQFTDRDGDTYPVISDVVNSSPTPDGRGERVTNSLFTEFQLPLHDTFDVQLAARYEDFDDVGNTTVGKVAFGWRPIDQVLIRGSWSEAFRAPNLVTINEQFIARSGTRNDWVCFYAADQGGLDPDDFSDCDWSVQRQATGSKDLKPEKSTNTSIGIVFEPIQNLTVTLDYWAIEKKDTIGLIGRENQILYDLILRLEAGIGNATVGDLSDCAGVMGNTAVTRDDFDNFDDSEIQSYLDAGLCPVGEPETVAETYLNLDTRTIEGHDIGVYYDFDTSIGSFYFRYNGSFYDKYEQTDSSPISSAIVDAKAADPTIVYPLQGVGDLLRIDGNQKDRQSTSLSWRKNAWGASVSGFRVGSFVETLGNEDRWYIPSMTTYNAKMDYSFDISNVDTRLRLGVNNFTDERAPLSDSYFGYFSDAHRDLGIYYYVDVRLQF